MVCQPVGVFGQALNRHRHRLHEIKHIGRARPVTETVTAYLQPDGVHLVATIWSTRNCRFL
jgi:hypothetical protein